MSMWDERLHLYPIDGTKRHVTLPVGFVVIISSLATCFRGDFFSPSYCCVYMHFLDMDLYSRSIITADSQQPPLDLEHCCKSLSTFLRLSNYTRGHHSLSERDL